MPLIVNWRVVVIWTVAIFLYIFNTPGFNKHKSDIQIILVNLISS